MKQYLQERERGKDGDRREKGARRMGEIMGLKILFE